MKKAMFAIVCLGLAPALAAAGDPTSDAAKNWASWRGPTANGVSPHGNPPVEWSEEKNILWKIPIPGDGLSTPIVWGDLVYLQTAIKTDQKVEAAEKPAAADEEGRGQRQERAARRGSRAGRGEGEGRPNRAGRGQGGPPGNRANRRGPGGRGRGGFGGRSNPTNIHQFAIMAYDRRTGKKVWEHTVREELPHQGSHRDGSLASASPVTDGEHIYAYFGSRGLYCFDMKGKLIWEKDFGDQRIRAGFGEGSSPALYGDTIVVNWDHEGDSFIVALDKKTGDQRWKVDRDESTSWSTPVIVEAKGKPQVVVAATNRTRAYDLATGNVVWECSGMTPNTIPSPVANDELVIVMSGYRGAMVQAIRYADAKGDITDSAAITWKHDKGTPYVPSPLLYDDTLYFLANTRNILSCFNTKTGTKNYVQQRLEGVQGVYAAPVAANGRVYIAGRNGTTAVLRHGATFELLATNKLDDRFDASPAIAGDELFLRGRKNLYCIAKK